jgi:hypothetical protein
MGQGMARHGEVWLGEAGHIGARQARHGMEKGEGNMEQKAAKTDARVSIPAMNTKQGTIRIVGTSPLVIGNVGKAYHPKGKNPHEDFMNALYWLTDRPKEFTEGAFNGAVERGARFGYPVVGLKHAVATGVHRQRLIRDKAKLYGALHISGDILEIQGVVPHMRTDTIDGTKGTTVMLYRAEFPEGWHMDVPITFTHTTFSFEQIMAFINITGHAVGIGAWRAEHGHDFGKFVISAVDGQEAGPWAGAQGQALHGRQAEAR